MATEFACSAVSTAAEDEELAAQRAILANAEHIQQLCADSYASLYERDDAILASLGQVWRRVGELAAIDPQFEPYMEARDGIKSQLEDLALFLRRYADGVEASPAALQRIEERLGKDFGARPWHVEGLKQTRWVLLDYVDFVVHVFHREARSFYDLDRLWADAPVERFGTEGEERA